MFILALFKPYRPVFFLFSWSSETVLSHIMNMFFFSGTGTILAVERSCGKLFQGTDAKNMLMT